MRNSARLLLYAIVVLAAASMIIWYVLSQEEPRGLLTVKMFKAGAALIQAPSGRWILIDGGADDSVLRELGSTIPFYDRSIDMVVMIEQTPAKAGGLAGVLDRYVVGTMVRSAALSSAPQLQAVTGAISRAQQSGARLLIARRGQTFELGDGAYLEILFPDRDASRMSAGDGCLMFKLVFDETSFLFACGSAALEKYLSMLDANRLRADALIGIGSEPETFLRLVSPQFLVTCGTSATSSTELSAITVDCSNDPTFISDGRTVREGG